VLDYHFPTGLRWWVLHQTPLIGHETSEWSHTLSLSMLLFLAGLRTELRSIRGFLEYGLTLAVGVC